MTTIQYLLIQLMEEAAEVQQAASKALRFGLDDRYPISADGSPTTQERLTAELTDLYAITQMLHRYRAVGDFGGQEVVKAKIEKVKQFMGYSREVGVLESTTEGKAP